MELDMIVVLGLALAFFGAITYLILKERNRQRPQAAEIQVLPQNNNRPVDRQKKRKL
jgi:flagellar biogenesis protein FliO